MFLIEIRNDSSLGIKKELTFCFEIVIITNVILNLESLSIGAIFYSTKSSMEGKRKW